MTYIYSDFQKDYSPVETEYTPLKELTVTQIHDWLKKFLDIFETEEEAILQYEIMYFYFMRTSKSDILKGIEIFAKRRKQDIQITCHNEMREDLTFPQFLWIINENKLMTNFLGATLDWHYSVGGFLYSRIKKEDVKC